MSRVTNVVLFAGVNELARRRALATLNAALTDWGDPALVALTDPTHGWSGYGGTRALECDIAIGALNHLRLEDLVQAIRAVPWHDPASIQLCIKEEESAGFRFVPLALAGAR